MMTSKLIKELQDYVKFVGDRLIRFVGIKKTEDDKSEIFDEEITEIHVIYEPNGRPHPTEPFYIHGSRWAAFRKERLQRLNWLGRLLKRFITESVPMKQGGAISVNNEGLRYNET